MKINPEEVNRIFKDCLYNDDEVEKGEVPKEAVIVMGIMIHVGFNPDRLNNNKENIEKILDNLHPTFKEGWSFLNMCLDNNYEMWTGSHKTMDELLCLGLAICKIEYCIEERGMWHILPGEMPYLMVK